MSVQVEVFKIWEKPKKGTIYGVFTHHVVVAFKLYKESFPWAAIKTGDVRIEITDLDRGQQSLETVHIIQQHIRPASRPICSLEGSCALCFVAVLLEQIDYLTLGSHSLIARSLSHL